DSSGVARFFRGASLRCGRMEEKLRGCDGMGLSPDTEGGGVSAGLSLRGKAECVFGSNGLSFFLLLSSIQQFMVGCNRNGFRCRQTIILSLRLWSGLLSDISETQKTSLSWVYWPAARRP